MKTKGEHLAAVLTGISGSAAAAIIRREVALGCAAANTWRGFVEGFDHYACAGDSISCNVDGFDIKARIEYDPDKSIDDDDVHNTDPKVMGVNEEQYAQLMEARRAWNNDEWFYCGLVLSVSRKGVTLDEHAASLWAIECNYPGLDNGYLLEVANELLDDALTTGRKIMESLRS